MPWPGMWCICLNDFRVSFRELGQDALLGRPCNSSYTAVVWARLSVWPIRTRRLTWSSTTSPNPNSVDLFQSSPKIKNSRAGKRKRCRKPSSVPSVRTVGHISAIPPSASPSSFRELTRRAWGQALHSSMRDKGKSWPFQPYSPVHIPQHPISFCSDSSMLSPAVFPQVSNITERERKKKSLCSSDPSEKQSFRCEQNAGLVSKLASTFNMQLPLFYLFKMWNRVSNSVDELPGPGAQVSPGAQSPAEVRSIHRAQAARSGSSSPRASCQQPSLHLLQPSSLTESGEKCLQPKTNHISEHEPNKENSPLQEILSLIPIL